MKTSWKIETLTFPWIFMVVAISGCNCCEKKTPTPPLGTQSDAIWRRQEAGASASDFVIYQHEFELNGTRLNTAGEDHLRSIAARLHCGAPVPVIIERCSNHVRPNTEFKYPVHPDLDLDKRRREMVVATLIAMGIPNADQNTVVAPALAEGFTAEEASQAYNQGLMNSGHGNNGGHGGGNGGNAANTGIGMAGTINADGSMSPSTSSL
jgi:hypothetical protein